MKGKKLRTILVIMASLCIWTAGVSAAELLSVGVHSSRYISMPTNIIRIAVGDPNIATVVRVPSSNSEFLVVAHQAGTTSLFVWGDDGARYEYIVGVSPEDEGQAKVIESAIGLPGVKVKMVNGKVLLSGFVENQYERNYAVRTAQLFVADGKSYSSTSVGSNANVRMETKNSPTSSDRNIMGGNNIEDAGQVIDLLHMRHPSQIKLEAQVIAINPKDDSDMGFVYGSSTGSNLLSTPGIFYAGESYGSNGTTFRNNPWKWLTDHHGDINVALRALVVQSKAKILSRPSITTMSGETALIQVGGEIPYTTRDSNGNPTTQFKDYGIILQFKPVVDAENRIITAVHTEVSKPSGEAVDSQPILDRRRADAVVTVTSGTTMVIGGLMDSQEAKVVRKFPFLGDIPVIGEFFKYTSKSQDKQELIILVTPRLVDENNASKTEMTRDMHEFYKKGQQEKAAMEKVDVNEKTPAADTAQEDTVTRDKTVNREEDDSRQIAAEMAQDSVLDRYLNRDVLPHK